MSKQEIADDVDIKIQLTNMSEMFRNFQMKIDKIEKKMDANLDLNVENPLIQGLNENANGDNVCDLTIGIQSETYHLFISM
jgi:hypothetical protein